MKLYLTLSILSLALSTPSLAHTAIYVTKDRVAVSIISHPSRSIAEREAERKCYKHSYVSKTRKPCLRLNTAFRDEWVSVVEARNRTNWFGISKTRQGSVAIAFNNCISQYGPKNCRLQVSLPPVGPPPPRPISFRLYTPPPPMTMMPPRYTIPRSAPPYRPSPRQNQNVVPGGDYHRGILD